MDEKINRPIDFDDVKKAIYYVFGFESLRPLQADFSFSPAEALG